MTFTGALPLFLAPEARRIANIGFGTGMTTHVLLASPRVERVDTIEIEPAMVQAAAAFRRVNWRAYDDPRSRIHYDDAKKYFSAQGGRYDVIVSEPSNPWVSGVASLFSDEFYRDVRRHLRDGGLFVQWVQLYEITPSLVATIVAALERNFSDYEFWLANNADMIIVAAHNGAVPAPDARAFEHAALRAELKRFRIENLDDLALHRVGGRAAVMPYFLTLGVEPNSDYFPVLEMKAPLARYMQSATRDLVVLRAALLECRLRLPDGVLPQQLADLARFVGVHLPSSAAVSFWRELASARCEAQLSAADRRWLRLHRAVAAGRAAEIASAADAILEAEPALQGALLAQALASFMAAKILTNEGAAAIDALAKHRARLGAAARDWAPVFRFLVVHAERS